VKKVLLISGSLGLGHVGRDLEIAKMLRQSNPEIQISWLADNPATTVLKQAGEKLLPETQMLTHGNKELESSAKDHGANLTRWVMNMRKNWSKNAKIVINLIHKYNFDLVIGDETYDLIIELLRYPSQKQFPFIIIYDFLGLDRVTNNPIDALVTYYTNRIWVKTITHNPPLCEKIIFIGEIEDIQDKKFGFLLPNRRKLAEKYFDFVGYTLTFNPKDYMDKMKIRKTLGYGKAPLAICSIGGTSAGKALLDLSMKAFPLIRKEIPDFEMVMVLGPAVPIESVKPSKGVKIVGYLPELYKHLAAADLAIITGGGTITLELTALKKPFLYFPLENHFEQEIAVADRCRRHNAGIRMNFSITTPEILATEIVKNVGREVSYAIIPTDGAEKAANLIGEFL
jgi:UDP-N-acetylglucosamine:LPS N-acetylglucosamine transferase